MGVGRSETGQRKSFTRRENGLHVAAARVELRAVAPLGAQRPGLQESSPGLGKPTFGLPQSIQLPNSWQTLEGSFSAASKPICNQIVVANTRWKALDEIYQMYLFFCASSISKSPADVRVTNSCDISCIILKNLTTKKTKSLLPNSLRCLLNVDQLFSEFQLHSTTKYQFPGEFSPENSATIIHAENL